MGDRRGADRVLVGIPKRMRRLGSPRRKWEDNIKVDLQDVGWGGKDWIELAQDKDRRQTLANVLMNFRVP
jgi:hypothetical protein